jgi:primary-amine oxidase
MQFKNVERVKDSGQAHDPAEMFGHLVAPHIQAQNHQHFFNFRLDMDVDGPGRNSVVEINSEGLPAGPANPVKNALLMQETLFHREQEAQRSVNMPSSRTWKVINPSVRNALNQPSGYMLVPGENAVPYELDGSFLRTNAAFVNHHLWVTQYDPAEFYAAGEYVNLGAAGQGLPKWTSANRPIENRDIVLWYTLGITHLPRVEDWPVMSVHRAGFKLVPAGFFSRNPALDAPKSQ